MSARECGCPNELVVRSGQAVIMVSDKDDPDIVRWKIAEDDDETPSDEDIEGALSVEGAWSDLDWDEVEQALYRIRHESVPTPPIAHP